MPEQSRRSGKAKPPSATASSRRPLRVARPILPEPSRSAEHPSFEALYQGTPPWDIGRPQPAIEQLQQEGEILGDVLDLGCGTGENALYLAGQGHAVVGIDLAPTAIDRARSKAVARGAPVRFDCLDAFHVEKLGGQFDTAIDCGLFHTLSDDGRLRYARAIHGALRANGRLHVLCFSEREPAGWGGPRRVTQSELRAAFRSGFEVVQIRSTRFATRMPEIEGHAWVASFRRI